MTARIDMWDLRVSTAETSLLLCFKSIHTNWLTVGMRLPVKNYQFKRTLHLCVFGEEGKR